MQIAMNVKIDSGDLLAEIGKLIQTPHGELFAPNPNSRKGLQRQKSLGEIQFGTDYCDEFCDAILARLASDF
jgi:hypothetical protein